MRSIKKKEAVCGLFFCIIIKKVSMFGDNPLSFESLFTSDVLSSFITNTTTTTNPPLQGGLVDIEDIGYGEEEEEEEYTLPPLPPPLYSQRIDDEEDEINEEDEIYEDEEDTVVTEECPICIGKFTISKSKKPGSITVREEVKCVNCESSVCKQCVIKYYEVSKEILPKCPICDTVWVIDFLYSNYVLKKCLRKYVNTIARKRIIDNAITREESMLIFASPIAFSYRLRRIVIEILVQLRCDFIRFASDASMKQIIRGKDNDKDDYTVACVPYKSMIDEFFSEDNNMYVDTYEKITNICESLILKIVNANDDFEEIRKVLITIASFTGFAFKMLKTDNNITEQVVGERLQGGDRCISFIKAKKMLIERANDINALHRFMVDLPRKVWTISSNSVAKAISVVMDRGMLRGTSYSRMFIHNELINELLASSGSGNLEDDSSFILKCVSKKTPPCKGTMRVIKQHDDDGGHMECGLCLSSACENCHELLLPEQQHVCEPDMVLSVQEIKKTTRGCPRCGTRITRIEGGCKDMFCTNCNQLYDWETMELHSTNTNPEYQAWLDRIKSRTPSSSSTRLTNDAEEIRQAFSASSRGEDGLTTNERNFHIMLLLRSSGLETEANILSIINDIETNIVWKFVSMIPTPKEFENNRISYMMGDISKDEWIERVERLEISGHILKTMIFILEEFITESTNVIKNSFTEFEESVSNIILSLSSGTHNGDVLRAPFSTRCIYKVAQCAIKSSNATSALFSCFTNIIDNKKHLKLFPYVEKYLNTVDRYEEDTTTSQSQSSIFDTIRHIRPTLRNGGYLYWSENMSEKRRLDRIFKIVNINQILGLFF